MRWLFIVGVSIEIGGALLLVTPILLPILLGRWEKLAQLGYVFPRGGVVAGDLHAAAFTLVGAGMLVGGFSVQLAGYVVQFENAYLIGIALAVVLGGLLAGGILAEGALTNWLLRKARENDPVAKAEALEARTREAQR
jgi:hypothetical protein